MTGLGKSVISMNSESSGSVLAPAGHLSSYVVSPPTQLDRTSDINLPQSRSLHMHFGGTRRLMRYHNPHYALP